jgi:prevent-host-death family protein
MDRSEDIQTLTDFSANAGSLVKRLNDTGRPMVLTVDGKAAAVIQDAEAYQRLLDLAAEASMAEGIKQGWDDATAGRTALASDVFDELRAEHGIPR